MKNIEIKKVGKTVPDAVGCGWLVFGPGRVDFLRDVQATQT